MSSRIFVSQASMPEVKRLVEVIKREQGEANYHTYLSSLAKVTLQSLVAIESSSAGIDPKANVTLDENTGEITINESSPQP